MPATPTRSDDANDLTVALEALHRITELSPGALYRAPIIAQRALREIEARSKAEPR
jgi:hypothetical protein